MTKISRLFVAFSLIVIGMQISATSAFSVSSLQPTGQTISSGGTNTCVITVAGKVKCWGDNEWGQSSPPAALEKATQISTAYTNACALDINGTVYCWGLNDYGVNSIPANLGVSKVVRTGPGGNACAINLQGKLTCWGAIFNGTQYKIGIVPKDIGSVKDVSLGQTNTCVVTINGQVKCWGDDYPEINNPPVFSEAVRQVVVAQFHACALLENGQVNCWGLQSSYGNLNVPGDLGYVTSIFANIFNTCALDSQNNVRCWGLSDTLTQQIDSLGKVQQFTLSLENDACALRVDGTLFCFGDNTYGLDTVPKTLTTPASISTSPWRTCAIDSNADGYCWGYNYKGIGTVPSALGKIKQIVGSYHSTCALSIEGNVTCWGDNSQGDSGPPPTNLGNVTQITAGSTHMCALNDHAVVTCWGKINYGFDTWNYQTPGYPAKAIQIAAGYDFTCAVYDDGAVKCWGSSEPYTSYGTTTVPKLGQVVKISTGVSHVCALDVNGKVTCWGMGSIASSIPKDLGVVKDLASGFAFTCAITSDDTVRCWDAYASNEWTPPSNLGKVASLSNGHGSAMCAISQSGNSKCWGQGVNFGQDFGQATIPSAVGDILGQNFIISEALQIQGKPIVGEVLSVLSGQWPADASLTYQWLRDGNLIDAETSSTYQVKDADFGHSITVGVIVSVSGYSATQTVSSEAIILNRYFARNPGTPSIDSSGGTLYAYARPQINGTSQTYKWFRDGLLIPDSTSDTYVLQSGDLTHSFVVEATYSQPGYISISSKSQPFVPSNLPPAPRISKVLPLDSNGNLRILFDPQISEGISNFPTNYQWSIDGGANWIRESDGVMPSLPQPNRYLDAHIGKPNQSISLVMRSMSSGGWGPASAPFSTSTSLSVTLSQPVITGTPVVGQTLLASINWIEPVDAAVSYKWLRDGVPISDATGYSYKLSPDDLRHLISVQATGSSNNYSSTISTSQSKLVGLGAIYSVSPPVILGKADPGSLLTVTSSNPGLRATYLWLRDGIATGVTSDSYETGLEDIGSDITVYASYSKEGYSEVNSTSSSLRVGTNITNSPCSAQIDKSNWQNSVGLKPTISGVGSYGNKLTAANGTWSSGTKFCFYWFENGQAIAGALSSSYKIQPSDIGQQIQYAVVGTDKAGKSMLRYSDPVAITNAVFVSSQSPRLGGNSTVGSKVTGLIVKHSGTTYNYQWQRNGTPINGATSATYQLTPQDLGSIISLQVCGSKQYFDSQCLSSSFQTAVSKGSIKPPSRVLIQGSISKPGAVLTGVAGNWPEGVNVSLQWLRDGSPINGATNTTYIITSLDKGHSITFQVTGTSNGYVDAVKTSTAKKIS